MMGSRPAPFLSVALLLCFCAVCVAEGEGRRRFREVVAVVEESDECFRDEARGSR